MSDKPLVKVEDLAVEFVSREAAVHAVNRVGFTLGKGDVLGIPGESGWGKSVMLRALMRLPLDRHDAAALELMAGFGLRHQYAGEH